LCKWMMAFSISSNLYGRVVQDSVAWYLWRAAYHRIVGIPASKENRFEDFQASAKAGAGSSLPHVPCTPEEAGVNVTTPSSMCAGNRICYRGSRFHTDMLFWTLITRK